MDYLVVRNGFYREWRCLRGNERQKLTRDAAGVKRRLADESNVEARRERARGGREQLGTWLRA